MLPQWILRERGGLDKVSEISDCPGRPLRFQPWILHPLSITKLDRALSNLVLPQIRPCFEQEVELESSWGPFQPEQSCDPMILWKKTSKVNQRPRDEVSGEYVTDMRHLSFCRSWMLLWMVGSYILYYYSMALLWGTDDLLSSPFSLPNLLQ